MTDVRLIPLDQLKFGHEADPPINVRQVGREAELETLAASLGAHGLIQALSVREIDGAYYVADGNRRLAALRLRAERHDISSDYEVRCDFTTLSLGADADEISLAANLEREPLHEADTYEKFRELADRGLTEDRIAGRFGIEVKRVRRMLALGKLSPMILKAWREGVFGHATSECVRAFTMAPSVEEQESVFERLKRSGNLSSYYIRREFGSDNGGAIAIRTAGLDAYIAAGGRYVEDLFGDNHVIYDVEIAQQVAAQKIEAELQRLRDEGWSWVSMANDLPQHWSWNWPKLTPEGKATAAEKKRIKALQALVEAMDDEEDGPTQEQEKAEEDLDELMKSIAARGFAADDMSKSGAVLAVSYQGEINITLGVVKPEAAKASAAASGGGELAKKEAKAPEASEALRGRLHEQLTAAARQAIVATPHAALAALVATISRRRPYPEQPVMVSVANGSYGSADQESFASVFTRLLTMDADDLIAAACAAMAPSVSLYVRRHDGDFADHTAALLDAMDGEALSAALVESFDADDYFKSAPKALTIDAIREAVNDDEARKANKMKKAELVAFALANVPKTGWLPPELRTSHYAGPGAAEPLPVAAE